MVSSSTEPARPLRGLLLFQKTARPELTARCVDVDPAAAPDGDGGCHGQKPPDEAVDLFFVDPLKHTFASRVVGDEVELERLAPNQTAEGIGGGVVGVEAAKEDVLQGDASPPARDEMARGAHQFCDGEARSAGHQVSTLPLDRGAKRERQ